MVKEYLEKMKESYINRRIELLKELTTLENLYKKNIKMIQLLEENDDSTIDSFTPRQINKYNRNKITELEQEQKDIDAKVQSLHNVISEMDCKIDEITSVIKVAREDIVSPDSIEEIELEPDMNMLILESVEGERQRIARDLHDSSVQSLTSLVHKVGAGHEIYIPVGRSGERGIETEVISGQDIQLNTELMDMLKKQL